MRTKFGNSRFSRSGDIIVSIETENGSCDPDHAPCHPKARLNIVYLCAKFDDYNFTHSRDIIGGRKI